MSDLLLLLLTSLLSYLLVGLIRRWADQRHIVDVPNHRSSHTRPTPRGGGLAIAVLVLLGWLIYGLLTAQPLNLILAFLLGGGLIAAVGWVDDLKNLPPAVRFVAQFLAAGIAVWGFGYWQAIAVPFDGTLNLGWVGLIITVIWIVGLTNAYNFMDGIDGIAGGAAALIGLGWLLLLGTVSGSNVALARILCLLMIGSSLGFLKHNWSPARIFMGDVGSAFLGYALAVLPLIPSGADQPHLSVVSVFLLWPFIFDTALTFMRRLRNGENVFAAHRSHLYQRLVILGFSHSTVTLMYLALSTLGLFAAWLWMDGPQWGRLAGMGMLLLACIGLRGFVQLQERQHAAQPSVLSGGGK